MGILTDPKWMAFDPEKLYVTVYPKDTEAKRIWHEEVGLPLDHIIDVEDNLGYRCRPMWSGYGNFL